MKHNRLMTESSTNVHEEWSLRVQALRRLFIGIEIEPRRHARPLCYHLLVEIVKELWLGRPPKESRKISLPTFLKSGACWIAEFLVLDLLEEVGKA